MYSKRVRKLCGKEKVGGKLKECDIRPSCVEFFKDGGTCDYLLEVWDLSKKGKKDKKF